MARRSTSTGRRSAANRGGGLREYKRKRDFRRTPEPAGKPRTREGWSFVVQRHHARRLHYDFRLELGGVLKSWAVPKGPSLNPKDRRLAAHTEDHPIEYGGFEGVIPQGEYGGGKVVVWDKGTWEPIGDPEAGYRQGKLKFTLRGVKLKGIWNLVKMPAREPGEDNWLLIKHDDEHAGTEDLTATRPESVLEESGPPKVWRNRGGTAEARAKETARPAIATAARQVPEGDDWIHEIELRGHRALCRVAGGDARVASETGEDWTGRFPTLVEQARALPAKEALLDGMIVVLDERGVSDPDALEETLGAGRDRDVVYFAFDLLELDGQDLRRKPLVERKETLSWLLENAKGKMIRYTDHVEGKGPIFWEQACEADVPAVVSKRRDSTYHEGKTEDWKRVACRSSAPPALDVALTNPDRVYWPDAGITKRDLAEYYASVADRILPHLVRRPLTLVRCPSGSGKQCFYQKHAHVGTPDEVKRVRIREGTGTVEGTGIYLYIEDLPALLSLAQMGVLELHPWGSTIDTLEKPDRMTFDLDPSPEVPWKDVVATALLIRERLDGLKLQSFVKTTGGKGLHVVVPLEPRHSWDDIKEWSRRVAQEFVDKAPDRFVATMTKSKRKGKIFIDFFRNTRGATAVAAYSTRARPGAPVSMPLSWDELPDVKDPKAFSLESLRRKLPPDPWKGFFDVRQRLPKL